MEEAAVGLEAVTTTVVEDEDHQGIDDSGEEGQFVNSPTASLLPNKEETPALRNEDDSPSQRGASKPVSQAKDIFWVLDFVKSIFWDTREEGTGLITYWQLIRHRKRFRWLWFGQAVSYFGDFFNFIATIAVLHRYSDSNLLITGIMISRLLPPVVLTPLLGAIADTYNRERILLICDAVRCLSGLGFLLVRNAETLWMLYLFCAIQSAVGGLFSATKAALFVSLVQENQVVGANALDITTWSISCALGSAAGGAFTGLAGTDASFLVDSLSYLVSAAFLFLLINTREDAKQEIDLTTANSLEHDYQQLNLSDGGGNTSLKLELIEEGRSDDNSTRFDEKLKGVMQEEEETEDNEHEQKKKAQKEEKEIGDPQKKGESFWEMTKEGAAYLATHGDVFLVCHFKASMAMIWGGVDVLSIAYSETEFDFANDGGSLTLGLLFAVIGLGCFLGPLLALRLSDEKSPTSLRFWLSWGTWVPLILGTWMGAWSPNLWLFLIGLGFVRPFGESIGYVFSGSVLQLTVPDHIRGRVFAYENSVRVLLESGGSFTAGLLLDEGLTTHETTALVATVASGMGCLWCIYYIVFRAYHLKQLKEKEALKSEEEMEMVSYSIPNGKDVDADEQRSDRAKSDNSVTL